MPVPQQEIIILTHPLVFTPFVEAEHRYVLLVGGAGSGKSYVTAQKLLARVMQEPTARLLVVRKVATTLQRSVFQLFKDLIYQHHLSRYFCISIANKRIECLHNGAQLLFIGLDDPEKIKSIQGISSIWVEEATELEDQDFRQLELRLRGHTPGYKQVVLTCNPISTENWVYQRFCGPEARRGDLLHIVSTAFDNPFINTDYLEMLTGSLADDPELFRIYARGEWGQARAKDLFYKRFDARQHIKSGIGEQATQPLHLSFDFNVQPYLTCTVWQTEGLAATQIAEFCLEGPRNTPDDMARVLLAHYGNSWPAGVYIYGDPAGLARQVGREGNPFTQLAQALKEWQPETRVNRSAPSVALRGRWLNRIFAGQEGALSIYISAICKITLADYAHVREAPAGEKLKTRVRDKNSGATYEPHGHCSDANDYFLCTLWAAEFKAFARGGKTLLPGRVGNV